MTATLDTQALKKLDQAHHLHPFTDFEDYAKHGGRIVSRAEHIYIYDSDGNKIQDGMSGLWCCNLGYSQDRIKQAVAEQLAELPFYNNFFRCSNQPAAELAARLSQVTPERFQHVFFTNSGSEANDTQIKLVHRYFDLLGKPEKKLIISRQTRITAARSRPQRWVACQRCTSRPWVSTMCITSSSRTGLRRARILIPRRLVSLRPASSRKRLMSSGRTAWRRSLRSPCRALAV